mmetsp:Transcript_86966/g.191042  ORF Transcript_86966/g.191042 Transcript_86966/m.191042 type:complete len:236 (+) Transcript_86966:354-1061(+)
MVAHTKPRRWKAGQAIVGRIFAAADERNRSYWCHVYNLQHTSLRKDHFFAFFRGSAWAPKGELRLGHLAPPGCALEKQQRKHLDIRHVARDGPHRHLPQSQLGHAAVAEVPLPRFALQLGQRLLCDVPLDGPLRNFGPLRPGAGAPLRQRGAAERLPLPPPRGAVLPVLALFLSRCDPLSLLEGPDALPRQDLHLAGRSRAAGPVHLEARGLPLLLKNHAYLLHGSLPSAVMDSL